ncbi:hypothetical protein ACI2I2_00180 [Scandinavium sp. NPDC088450]|uniref:hypothetical protein n=1 Tax=Scandinavium sp. NPDC088450 TaxID=3364514 RepID=UPI00384B8D69
MPTTHNPYHDLLTLPFNAATDFIDLADYCDRFASTLIECHKTTEKLALLGRLNACLALIRPTLDEPIPPHLIARFTVESLPSTIPIFEPDAETLCGYCQTLAEVLCQQSFLPKTENTLRALLCELIWMFAADLKAPRWVAGNLPH